MNQAELKTRLKTITIIMGISLGFLLFRLFYLQGLKKDKFTKIALGNIVRRVYVKAPRGEIKDRKGKTLAYDVPRLNVCAVKAEIKNLDDFAKAISPIISISQEKIKKIILRYKDTPYQKIILKAKVNTPEMMQIAEIQADIPGLHLEVQPVREYPNKEVACHLLGYVGEVTDEQLKQKEKKYKPGDYIGKDGLEKVYDDFLQGTRGQRRILVDVSGRYIKLISEEKPNPGNNIILSIDLDFQKRVDKILSWHVKSLSRISKEKLSAVAIVMKADTGEILAMASKPGFNPNLFSKGISVKDYKSLIQRKDYPLLNRAISGGYPPASTFKMITAAAALEEGLCNRHSPFKCTGAYKVGKQVFNCFVKTGHGKINFSDSIAQSCDVVFYILGHKLGIKRLLLYCKKFGLGKRTGIDLPGESIGILPNEKWKMETMKEEWYTGDTINMSIGQGYLNVTPLQMAVATSAVANKKKLVRPHLMEKIEKPSGEVVGFYKKDLYKKVSINPIHFSAIQEGMRTAVKKGTAKRLRAKISAAGKTGTAENSPSPENPNGRNHTWFVGFAPAYKPDIVIVVFFEKSGGYAGKVVVPIVSEILHAYCKYFLK